MTRRARHRRLELRASAGLKTVSVQQIGVLYGQTLNRKREKPHPDTRCGFSHNLQLCEKCPKQLCFLILPDMISRKRRT
ncbi:hypothetical protein BUE72_16745 [Bacillus amyloliquefaciens]|nr:hypothetical protein BUE72_16745 [Bacillus amyloliquefaciens]